MRLMNIHELHCLFKQSAVLLKIQSIVTAYLLSLSLCTWVGGGVGEIGADILCALQKVLGSSPHVTKIVHLLHPHIH